MIILNNLQRSNELNNQKMSKLTQDILDSMCHNEAFDMIEYLEERRIEQQKRDNINLIISIISAIGGIGACIIGLFQLFNS